ncbi:hypothetical protein [Leptothoe spongobia]|uniref:PIN domain-containing protein n=1 Tax=Leptothoe spongobia TAU-MAC 1115 TaxID=1967444 RepID=A0A947GM79_9CYAN|nr:hypothetical protein [Leptothoe spongobia]MBT9317833.1 hypothetical protein [Leptothoe spongobia TAU-MAC 1115]
MKAVAIVDTSIFCNILNIPQKNGERSQVMHRLKSLLEQETNLLLPMAAIYEAGNYIAQLSDGGNRRRFAEVFIQEVGKAIQGEAPWQVMQLPNTDEVGEWLNSFPDSAMRGAGIGDLSMIKEWEKMIRKAPSYRVFIWSIDSDLQGYEYTPSAS